MKWPALIALAFATAACFRAGSPLPDDQTTSFCLHKKDWPQLIEVVDEFARLHGLKRIGGADESADGRPMLNVALADGYNYYFGDDLDLWITSSPFVENATSLSVIHRDKRPTHEQWQLGRGLLKAIKPLTWSASGSKQNPSCAPQSKAPPQTPQ
jgi:hypothetical protein